MVNLSYYSVFSRENGRDLTFVADIQGSDARDALFRFTERFGDNYGKVVVLPQMRSTLHHAYEYLG